MSGDTRKTFWGKSPEENWSKSMCKAFGCQFKYPNKVVKHIIEKVQPETTARMVMQAIITPEREKTEGPKSREVPDQI